jgi:DNA-binding response OmpR family regulator
MNFRRRILCVEGDQNIRELPGILLRRAGYQVKSDRTLEESISLDRRESFDLYMLDQMFWDGIGRQLGRWLKDFDSYIPILFL